MWKCSICKQIKVFHAVLSSNWYSTCDPCVSPSSQPLLFLQLSFSPLNCPLGLGWKSPPYKWRCAAETELYSQSRSVAFGQKGLSQMTLPSTQSGLMLFSMSLAVVKLTTMTLKSQHMEKKRKIYLYLLFALFFPCNRQWKDKSARAVNMVMLCFIIMCFSAI